MLYLLASILLVLNPVIGSLIADSKIPQIASTFEAILFGMQIRETQKNNNGQFYQLPLQADIFIANQYLPSAPLRDWRTEEPEIKAKTALIYDTTHQTILYKKNDILESQPIASITKLMTALVAVQNSNLNSLIKVSKEAVQTEGEMGGLVAGEELTIKSLLFALLLESSNDAAIALAQNIPFPTGDSSVQKFVELMNKKTKELNLKKTAFADPSGLDPQNYSSAWDINLMMQEILKDNTLKEILQTREADIHSVDGHFNHHLISTNKLLGIVPEIIGGKTGYIEEAGNCMTAAFNSPSNEGDIITVVIDSPDRIAETKTLFEWTKKAYLW